MGDNDWGLDWTMSEDVGARAAPTDIGSGASLWQDQHFEVQPLPPQPYLQTGYQQQPATPQPVAARSKRMVLIGLGVVLIIGLLAVVGVAVTRSGGNSPAPVAASSSHTTVARSTVDLSGLCGKLGPSLPAKAQGLKFQNEPSKGHAGQHCEWWPATGAAANATWGLMVDVAVPHDISDAQSWFDAVRGLLESPKAFDVTTTPVPGVGDQALVGPIPDSDLMALSRPGIDLKDYSRPGAVALVRARNVVIRIEWCGADYPPGTPPDDRNHNINGTALPPEQAESEAVALAKEVIRLIGV